MNMKVKVTDESVLITEYSCINEGEVGVNICEFDLPECFAGLRVTAVFDNLPVPVNGDFCIVPPLKKGTVTLGVYAYNENAEEIVLMYSPKATVFYVNKGSYSDEIGVENTPTITEFEQYCHNLMSETQQVMTGFEKAENKVSVIDENSTDEQYPTAKAVYQLVGNSVLKRLANGLKTYFTNVSSVTSSKLKSTSVVSLSFTIVTLSGVGITSVVLSKVIA